MGGASDLPQRSSSPLKRRASDLEPEAPSRQNDGIKDDAKDDVDMIMVPTSDAPEPVETSNASARPRSMSVDMTEESPKLAEAAVETTEVTPAGAPSPDPKTVIPPIDEQIKIVTTLCQAEAENQLNEGDQSYLVSKRWLGRVLARGSEALKSSKVAPEGEIGPVDNSDLIQQIITDCEGKQFVQLRSSVTLGDFEFFPEDAWKIVEAWYGIMPGTIAIVRTAHNTNPDKINGIPNMVYELHPVMFTIHRVFSDTSPINLPQKLKATNPPAPVFVFSRSTRYHTFLKKIKEKSGIPMEKKVRIWRVPRLLPASEPVEPATGAATPPSSRPGSPVLGVTIAGAPTRQVQDTWTQLLLDTVSFIKLERGKEREMVDTEDVTVNKNYNGKMDLSLAGLGEDQTIVLDEFISGNDFVTTFVNKGNKVTSSALARTTGTRQSVSQPTSGRNSPAPSGPMTRGRTAKSGRTVGTCGMSNLGNTCYMNSALQCVRSVEELSKYFLSGNAKLEINDNNPLGNNGDVARVYSNLLTEIYEVSPNIVTPRSFKATISKYAPTFSGYGQQDSQEFVGFLLDGLQEDLSRILKKPYIEKPDSTDEMVNNPAAIKEMADKVWDITKKRDDSVIADLFTGMYKSTLVCPACDKISITFDPFNNLTLQLPVDQPWTHDIIFCPLNDRPVLFPVDVPKHTTIGGLKAYISKKVGVPPGRLFGGEDFKNKFYRIYSDNDTASEAIGNSDKAVFYELEMEPTNTGPREQPKKSKSKQQYTHLNFGDSEEDEDPYWESPLAERLLVPVFHRHPNNNQSMNRFNRSSKRWLCALSPHFIMLTKEEARDEDIIKRKILEKIATWSTYREFLDDEEVDASVVDSIDPDIVLTTGSDADSAGGSKVVANSVDGDDELVDVTMKDTNSALREATEKEAAASAQNSGVLATFNTTRPKFMTPGSHLNPGLQSMFDIGFFEGAQGEPIPTGWNAVDEDKEYVSISSRNPHVDQVLDDEPLDGYAVTNGRSGSESSEEEDPYQQSNGYVVSTTRMTEESSEEDDIPNIPRKVLPVRPANHNLYKGAGHKKRRGSIKTYSKKGNRLARKIQQPIIVEQDAPDEGPLVRIGEGLVCDWRADAWDAVFGGDGKDDDFRGVSILQDLQTLPDPEMVARRQFRQKRKKNGITLNDCLDEFNRAEVLSDADKWYCPRCKEHRNASKKFELWRTPDILIIHLKRFSSTGMRRDKVDILVDFPVEGLDLSSRVVETQEGKQEIYDLFAVDDHWGGLGGGHYTAFAKNWVDHNWYEYNDTSASKVNNLDAIVTSSAYLLFYRRRSEKPLGGENLERIVAEYDNPSGNADNADTDNESGEDQRLVENSSLRGSSSALTGAGAVLRQPNRGSEGGEEMTTINPSALEGLPSYEDHQNDETIPLLVDDTPMHDGVRESIEDEDEAIDMGNGYNSISFPNTGIIGPTWDFANLSQLGGNTRGNTRGNMISGTGSDIDEAASDLVNHDSSASEGSLQGRLDDFENALPVEDDGTAYIDQSEVPDMDEDGIASTVAIRHELLDDMNGGRYRGPTAEFEVPAEEMLEVEEPAMEIHIEDGDELKME